MKLLASTTFRRDPAAVPAARKFVRTVLVSLDLTDDAQERLVLASAEACNNVVLHADCDTFTVTVSRDDRSCVIDVTDSGHGFYVPSSFEMPPANEVGRRGLALMQALVDRVRVASSPMGTAVMLSQALATSGAPAAANGTAAAVPGRAAAG